MKGCLNTLHHTFYNGFYVINLCHFLKVLKSAPSVNAITTAFKSGQRKHAYWNRKIFHDLKNWSCNKALGDLILYFVNCFFNILVLATEKWNDHATKCGSCFRKVSYRAEFNSLTLTGWETTAIASLIGVTSTAVILMLTQLLSVNNAGQWKKESILRIHYIRGVAVALLFISCIGIWNLKVIQLFWPGFEQRLDRFGVWKRNTLSTCLSY